MPMPEETKKAAIEHLFRGGGTWHHNADSKTQMPADDPEGCVFRTKCKTFLHMKKSNAATAPNNDREEDTKQFALGNFHHYGHDCDFFFQQQRLLMQWLSRQLKIWLLFLKRI